MWNGLAAIGVFIIALAAIPPMLGWARRNGKGMAAGFMLGVGMMFASLFDPAKAQATEELDRTKRTGGPKQQQAGDPKNPTK
jgi:predicted negative regulator of RcsB-dependent stress response